MNLNDIPAFVVALGTFAGAAILGYRRMLSIVEDRATRTERKIVEVDGHIFEMGKALDGRLTLLLEQTEKRAHAEGRLDEKAEEAARKEAST